MTEALSSAVDRFLAAQRDAGSEFHSLTVLRSGERLIELAAAPWALDSAALVYSMSKTFTSAAFGICLDERLVSLDDLVIDVVPEVVDERVGPKARTIRLRDCLAMASGHDFDTIELVTGGRWEVMPEIVGEFLRAEPAGEVGVDFKYNQLCTYAVSVAVTRATGKSVHQLVRERILDPLGAGPTHWYTDPTGTSTGFSGLHIAPRDLASFIGLLAAGGVHRGERLLPQRWIDEYSIKRVDTTIDEWTTLDWAQGYGWQVWRGQDGGHRADGAYGQYGLIWPERELAVVITSNTVEMQATIDQVREILLPALDDLSVPEVAPIVAVARGDGPVPDTAWTGSDTRGGTLELTSVEHGWELVWNDADGGSHRLGVGHGHWVEGAMHWPGREARVACSGAMTEAGVVIHVAAVQTPHTAVLTLADEATLTWNTQPLGQDTLAGVSLPVGWDE